MLAIRIQALGPLRIWLNGEQVPDKAWPTQKSRQLFEILLINHGRMVTADRLMDNLWPTLGVKQARNNLWVSISQVRRVLQPDLAHRAPSEYIHKQGEGYLFQPNHEQWIDIEAFQKRIRLAHNESDTNEHIKHLQRAVELYQGNLCAEDPYAEWTIQPRDSCGNYF